MATYNLNFSRLESMLDHKFSPGAENAIISAIRDSGMLGSGFGKIDVEMQNHSGAYNAPPSVQLFLDTGANNSIQLTDHGHTIVAAGDKSNSILDKGPGGDTLIGGLGDDKLQVTHGANLLVAGAGQNTLVGGAGHDTLVGGGASWLQAGTGGSTLLGGLGESSTEGDRHGGFGQSIGFGESGRSGYFGSSGRDYDRDSDRHGDRHHQNQGGGGGGAQAPSDTLIGGAGSADWLQVFHGDNLIAAGDGHDTITGGDGHDTIYGGGSDTININYGNEFVQGGAGTDQVNVGLHGNDVIYGGAATTVESQQTSTSIVKEYTAPSGVTTITFSDHQVLTLQKVTIDFADGAQKTV